jgi:hypothetical protein
MTAKVLMIQGSSSSAGKNLLVTALCRIFTRRGMKVAPFKAQNMSNNAAVCAAGSEIRRAQALQAAACGIPPTADMNPVLIKLEANSRSQIIVMGRPWLSYKNMPQTGKPNVSFRERLMAESILTNLRSAINDGFNIQTQGNGRDQGGTCNGDSGGPVFLGDPDSNLIVAVTSFGLNVLCRGTDFSYRVDQADVLAWLTAHMYTP